MKIACDNREFSVTILTDLLKACGCIYHDLLIAKLNAYEFDQNELKLIYDCLSGRSQKTLFMVYWKDVLSLYCLT